ATFAELNQHLVEQAIEAPVPPTGLGGVGARDGVKVGVSAVVVPEPSLVVTDQALIARKTVYLVSNFPHGEQRPTHRPVQAVVLVVADGGVAVIPAAHDVSSLSRSHFDESTPGGVGIGGHAGGVKENTDGIAVKAVLHEHVVVR